MEASWGRKRQKQPSTTRGRPGGGVDPREGWIANLQELSRIAMVSITAAPRKAGAPDPLALRANPATVPRVRLVKLVKLGKFAKLVKVAKLVKLR